MESCQFYQNIHRNGMLAVFISGICALRHKQMIGQLLLCQIFIFAQTSDSFELFHCPNHTKRIDK